MANFIGGLGGLPLKVAVRYMETTEAAEIHKAADELGADLIVVSTQGKGAVARMVLGSVTQQVLQTAAVDVLAIPTARSA